MEIFKLDLGEIADLATEVAVNGAIRVAGGFGDELFENIVSIAVLIYEMYPDG